MYSRVEIKQHIVVRVTYTHTHTHTARFYTPTLVLI